jgi:prepilin-type N-terminal cleavage/methylation domain-containing protein
MQKNINNIKKGFTLVETLVALAIFALGMAATVLVFAKTIKSKAYALEMGKSSFVVSRSVSDLIGYIRRAKQSDDGSYPIVSADKNSLVVYSDYDKDGVTERLHVYYELATGKVWLGIGEPSTTYPKTYALLDATHDTDTKIELAKQIVNTASDAMFTYYNKDYPQDTVNNPVPVPADVSQIRLVKIFLKINIDINKAPDNIQQESFVELRNLNDYDRIR